MNDLTRLMWHLYFNFDPPCGLEDLKFARKALDKVNSGKGESLITFPNGLIMTANEVIDNYQLEDFIGRIIDY